MSDINSLRKEAIKSAEKAIEYDKNNNLEEAFRYYLKAAEDLNQLILIDGKTKNKEIYEMKRKEYIERGKKLKDSKYSNIVEIRKKALEKAQKAVEYDNANDFLSAYKYYLKSADKLHQLILIDENDDNKKIYRKKRIEYTERAKKIIYFKSPYTWDLVTLREEVVEAAQKAVDFDEQDNYELANKYYMIASEKLNFLSKIDENVYNREIYKKKSNEYFYRASYLAFSLERDFNIKEN